MHGHALARVGYMYMSFGVYDSLGINHLLFFRIPAFPVLLTESLLISRKTDHL